MKQQLEKWPSISKVCQNIFKVHKICIIPVVLSHYYCVFSPTHFCVHFGISKYTLADNPQQIEDLHLMKYGTRQHQEDANKGYH